MKVYLVCIYEYSLNDFEREARSVVKVFDSYGKALDHIKSIKGPHGNSVEPGVPIYYKRGERDEYDEYEVEYYILEFELE